jgi:WD40 repeat protein
VNDVTFSKDGKILVVAGGDGVIRLLDGASVSTRTVAMPIP